MPSKAVVDTNIWISAFFSPLGIPRKIADSFRVDAFTLVCADELIAELVTVTRRPHIAVRLYPKQVQEFISLIYAKAVFVQLQDIPAISPDPKDDMFLACAAAASCDFLVTGNKKDLLDLGTHGTTKIVTAAQFLDNLVS